MASSLKVSILEICPEDKAVPMDFEPELNWIG